VLPLVEQPRSSPQRAGRGPEWTGLAGDDSAATQAPFCGLSPGRAAYLQGWEFAAALDDRRDHSILALADDAVIVLDEPEQIRGAADRLWKRIEQRIEQSPEEGQAEAIALAEANFFRWRISSPPSPAVSRSRCASSISKSPRPTSAHARRWRFTEALQVAVAEAKTMVEQGLSRGLLRALQRELERLADILREYSVRFSWASRPTRPASPYPPSEPTSPAPSRSTYLH